MKWLIHLVSLRDIEHGDPLPFEIKDKKDFRITNAVPISINA